MKEVFLSGSPEDTLSLGEKLAGELARGAVVLLYGDLGAGKSVFARGMARFYGIPEKEVRSPTFTLLNIYPSSRGAVNHFDLYRIEDSEELFQLGFDEHLEEGVVSIIEWAEKAEIPPGTDKAMVIIKLVDETTREITIER
ncbi:tRNA (adenosine(37)-N6)-threonylcarbamoyltransferase complex ATPase subunit type 1 TsaE [Candidatus Mcinerneyibacteriota bacterium]|nr:tRNA (adenosine(37)-N6)-threonylcarbamoyltransferase complex ATPase subunit type 1 TsaE [Candidatus Mcinerneyibacteriota bacterium]